VALGLINSKLAKADGFSRGTGSDSPNLVEWDYFPDTGFGATISSAIASAKSQFAAGFTFPAELVVGKKYSVRMEYDPAERTLKTFMLENDKAWKTIKTVALADDFVGFAVDAFSISSYTAKGSELSLLANGHVDNLAIGVGRSKPRIVNTRLADGQWTARSFGYGTADYLLERSADLREWQSVENGVREDGFYLRLIDENLPVGDGFYRLGR
jgi:hypothetical protein